MRVLVLTANFAPRGTSASVRSVHLVQGLAALGHDLKVVTYDRDVQLLFSPEDESLDRKVPDAVEVIRLKAGLLHRLTGRSRSLGSSTLQLKRKLTSNILSSLVIPDPHIAARRSFEKRAQRVIDDWRPDVLLTFSYPFTFTLAGSTLKRRNTELVWIADYGDPWTGSPVTELNLPRWRQALDRRIEQQALSRADAVSMTTQRTVDLYRRQFPILDKKLHVLTMGYDAADVDGVPPSPRPDDLAETQLLVHAGRLYGEARDPGPLIDAMSRLYRDTPEEVSRLRILLLGEVEDSIRRRIEASPAARAFVFSGWVTVEESIAIMKSADWLLLFGNKGEIQVPGKVYQYIGTGRPVFMTCESGTDAAAGILDRVGRSLVVRNETSALADALKTLACPGAAVPPAKASAEEYSWTEIARKMAAVFETVHAQRVSV